MTDDERKQAFALRLWKANVAGAKEIADAAVTTPGIPPEVQAVPGVERFLTRLQKLSFMHGCLATLDSLEQMEPAMDTSRRGHN
jgi:hypothetical protein